MNPDTEGDARTETHAKGCPAQGKCKMYCRCWCHGITVHPNGSIRADAHLPATITELGYQRQVCKVCRIDWPCPDRAEYVNTINTDGVGLGWGEWNR